MPVFYTPPDGVAADVIPFFWDGEFHLFYLKDYRDPEGHGRGTPWEHLSTRDFARFTEYPQALPRGAEGEQDLWVFTGCVIERDGLFHIFYTGHNALLVDDQAPLDPLRSRPKEAVMHATSADLVRWTKDAANPVLFADPERFEPHDWRDPFVFWNPTGAADRGPEGAAAEGSTGSGGEYWMLLAARLRGGPSRRRGCIALATSPDLAHWTIREPFWAPRQYYTHECPDLFRMGDWWYLVYSTFSERQATHYRMSRSLRGPWLAPADDTFDARAFYAAKTVTDGRRRFVCGWNPTREGASDSGRWHWGGALVTHEVLQQPDGRLTVRVPDAVDAAFGGVPGDAHGCGPAGLEPVTGEWRTEGGAYRGDAGDGYGACRLGAMPEACRLSAEIECAPGTRAAGLALRMDGEWEAGYEVRWEPGRSRLVFDRWPRPGDQPFVLERPLDLAPGEPLRLRIYVEGTVIEIYANERVALSTRGYDHRRGDWGLFVYEGQARFAACALDAPAAAAPAAGAEAGADAAHGE